LLGRVIERERKKAVEALEKAGEFVPLDMLKAIPDPEKTANVEGRHFTGQLRWGTMQWCGCCWSTTGGTALHWAVRMGHEAVVRLLLEHNVNVNAKDNYNRYTALH
jgi:hypothetical protein